MLQQRPAATPAAAAAACRCLPLPQIRLKTRLPFSKQHVSSTLPCACRHRALPLVCRALRQLANSPALNPTVVVTFTGEQRLLRLRSFCCWFGQQRASVRRLSLQVDAAMAHGPREVRAAALLAAALAGCGAAGCQLWELQLGLADLQFPISGWLSELRSLRSLAMRRTDEDMALHVDCSLAGLTHLLDLSLDAPYDGLEFTEHFRLPTPLTRLSPGGPGQQRLQVVTVGEARMVPDVRSCPPAQACRCASTCVCMPPAGSKGSNPWGVAPPWVPLNMPAACPPLALFPTDLPAVAAASVEPLELRQPGRGLRPAGGAARTAPPGAGSPHLPARLPAQPPPRVFRFLVGTQRRRGCRRSRGGAAHPGATTDQPLPVQRVWAGCAASGGGRGAYPPAVPHLAAPEPRPLPGVAWVAGLREITTTCEALAASLPALAGAAALETVHVAWFIHDGDALSGGGDGAGSGTSRLPPCCTPLRGSRAQASPDACAPSTGL